MKKGFRIITLILLYSCGTTETKEQNLKKEVLTLDSMMRSPEFNEYGLRETLKRIEINLTRNDKVLNDRNENWIINADIKYNQDSSIVFIRTNEKWKQGFQRQVVIHIGDSVLYTNKFSVLTEDNDSLGYELIDVLDYLTPNKNIKRLVKREFPKPLTDTTALRQLTFEPYQTTPDELPYLDEVEDIRVMVRR